LALSKPMRACVPSQYGLIDEPPQRQSATFSPSIAKRFPSTSTMVTGPVTR